MITDRRPHDRRYRARHEEILFEGGKLHPGIALLPASEGALHIGAALERFRPRKTTGHLDVNDGHANFVLPTDENEFRFSARLDRSDGPALLFFEQDARDRNCAILFPRLAWLSEVMAECSGHEYFVTNREADFLLSVNWHAIAGVGDIHLVP